MNGSNWVKDLYITDYTHNPDNRRHSKYGDIALRATVWRTDRGPGGPEIILEKGKFYRHRNLCVKHDPQGFLEGKFDLTQSRISSSKWRWDTKMKDLLHSKSKAWFPSRHTFTQSSNAGEETLIKD